MNDLSPALMKDGETRGEMGVAGERGIANGRYRQAGAISDNRWEHLFRRHESRRRASAEQRAGAGAARQPIAPEWGRVAAGAGDMA